MYFPNNQVRDTDDAVRELWKRKDITERKLITSLRAAAGLPSQDDFSPYSDDEQSSPVGRSLKFSVNGLNDKSTNNSSANTISKDALPNKNPTKKTIKFVTSTEGSYPNYDKQNGERSLSSTVRTDGPESQRVGSNRYSTGKELDVDEVSKVQTDSWRLHAPHFKECTAKMERKNENVKGTKLVIHLGSKNRNVSSSPRSEASGCHKEQDSAVPHGEFLFMM